jgi:hypothetical protein
MSTLRHHTTPVVGRAGRTAPDTRRPASDPLQLVVSPAFGPLPPTVAYVFPAQEPSSRGGQFVRRIARAVGHLVGSHPVSAG